MPHAGYLRCDADFFINRLVESMLFKVNHIQLELLGRGRKDDRAREL
jgi:hypothetical protein